MLKKKTLKNDNSEKDKSEKGTNLKMTDPKKNILKIMIPGRGNLKKDNYEHK